MLSRHCQSIETHLAGHHQLLKVTFTPIGDQQRLEGNVHYREKFSIHGNMGE